MKQKRNLIATAFLLLAFGYRMDAQNIAPTINSTTLLGVNIEIEQVINPSISNSDVIIKVTITNNSENFLVRPYVRELSSTGFEIKDQNGAVPSETDLGCKRHKSMKCGSHIGIKGPTHAASIIVDPGKSISYNYNLGKEYNFEPTHTYYINAIVENFLLVDAPKRLAGLTLREMAFLNYTQYPYKALGVIRSNSIQLRLVD